VEGAPRHSIERLLAHVRNAPDRDTLLDVCLDTVVELCGADRGLILLTEGGQTPYVVNARADGRALGWAEREEISRSIVREALARGERVVWRAEATESGALSMVQLGIQLAVAEPIQAPTWRGGARRPTGVLYLDYRSPVRAHTAERDFDLVAAAAGLVSIVQEPLEELGQLRERQRESQARRAEAPVTLAELLAPRSMAALGREIESAIHGQTPLLVLGESGTGKTLLAHAIAEASGRRPVVRATLGSSDDLNTITSELFGHERGSFSGALARRKGMVEFADGGTLILDELLNLPLAAQRLLLDFTQFGTYRPLGHERPEPARAHVRLIAVTNGDLEAAVRAGRFRQDLFFRLAGTRIEMPPLRTRRSDVPALAEAVLGRADAAREWRIAVAARRMLASPQLGWPGNVRQLEMVVLRARERALSADARASVIELGHFEPRDLDVAALPAAAAEGTPTATPVAGPAAGGPDLALRWRDLEGRRDALDEVERQLLEAALAEHEGVVAHAARHLGLPRTSLVSRLQALGVRPNKSRD